MLERSVVLPDHSDLNGSGAFAPRKANGRSPIEPSGFLTARPPVRCATPYENTVRFMSSSNSSRTTPVSWLRKTIEYKTELSASAIASAIGDSDSALSEWGEK